MEKLLESFPTPTVKVTDDRRQFKEKIKELKASFIERTDSMRKQDVLIRIASWKVHKLSPGSFRLYEDRIKSIVDIIQFYGFQIVAFPRDIDTLEAIKTLLGGTGVVHHLVKKKWGTKQRCWVSVE